MQAYSPATIFAVAEVEFKEKRMPGKMETPMNAEVVHSG